MSTWQEREDIRRRRTIEKMKAEAGNWIVGDEVLENLDTDGNIARMLDGHLHRILERTIQIHRILHVSENYDTRGALYEDGQDGKENEHMGILPLQHPGRRSMEGCGEVVLPQRGWYFRTINGRILRQAL